MARISATWIQEKQAPIILAKKHRPKPDNNREKYYDTQKSGNSNNI
jgi:hypothetical protein